MEKVPADKQRIRLFESLYDVYSAAFYGEITRNLYQQDICEQTLIDAYKKIWESLPQFDETKENRFAWCFKIVGKEISKKKIDLLLKEIFACQRHPTQYNMAF